MKLTMQNKQTGFTLIELMIVIAIIAILAAFALPAYGDYTKRTYVVEGIQLANVAKMAVVDSYTTSGVVPSDNAAAGLPPPADIRANSVNSVKGIRVAGNPATQEVFVQIAYSAKVKDFALLALALDTKSGAGSYRWICGRTDSTGPNGGQLAYDNTSSGTDLPNAWLPSNCRG